MPNSERWLYWEDYFTRIFTRMDRGLISAHMCSYQCFLASAVGDPETRCYFPEQGPRDPRVRANQRLRVRSACGCEDRLASRPPLTPFLL